MAFCQIFIIRDWMLAPSLSKGSNRFYFANSKKFGRGECFFTPLEGEELQPGTGTNRDWMHLRSRDCTRLSATVLLKRRGEIGRASCRGREERGVVGGSIIERKGKV